jgi:hypothetical protein
MDYDGGKIDVTDLQGIFVESITLPADMDQYKMEKLYKSDDGSAMLYFEGNSYLISDLKSGNPSKITGFSKDKINSHTVNKDSKHARLQSNGPAIQFATNELIGQLQILNIDKEDNLYTDFFEQVDTAKVAGEYTVKKFQKGKLAAVSPISLDGYYFAPNNVLQLSENGDLYQIICYADHVDIIKKAFIEPSKFTSRLSFIKREALTVEKSPAITAYASAPVTVMATTNAPNSKATTQTNANNLSALSWTYKAANASNPSTTNVTTPDYLVGVTTPSSQTGVPYAWGGFDGQTTSSSSGWTSFTDAMSKGKFAGNVNTSTAGWQANTAGFDCSGFISSAAGFTSKLSTSNLASSTYTTAVTAANIQIYDMYVKSGDHALFYTGDNSTGVNSRECTTTGDDKTKSYSRTSTWLSSNNYVLRRFNGW